MAMLQKKTLLCEDHLHGKTYLEDLLAEGERVGVLSQTDVFRMQYDVLELLRERLEAVYGTQGSSVPDELAEELMESVLYTVSLALRASPDPDAAVSLLKETPLVLLYQKGLRYCRIFLRDVRVLTAELQKQETDAFDPFYRAVIHRDLPAFVRRYRPDSRAHDHGFFPVYALAHPQNDLLGVEYVRAYALSLLAETRFCNLFDKTDLAYVLSSPRERDGNLFSAVLRRVAVSLLVYGTVGLRVTESDARFAAERFPSRAHLEQALQTAFAKAAPGFAYAVLPLRAVAWELWRERR